MLTDTKAKVSAAHRADEEVGREDAAGAGQVPRQRAVLKHNLNAAAISSLQGTAGQIEGDVAGPGQGHGASIAEADEFMKQMK